MIIIFQDLKSCSGYINGKFQDLKLCLGYINKKVSKLIINIKEKYGNSEYPKLYGYIDQKTDKLIINIKEEYKNSVKMETIDDKLIIYFNKKIILEIKNKEFVIKNIDN